MIRKPLSKHRIMNIDKALAELAEEGGVSAATLSRIERGYLHSELKARQKFADLYGLTLEAYEEMVRGARESA